MPTPTAGIEAAAGNRVGAIAHAVGRVCRTAGHGIPDGFGGHGVGRRTHEDPEVPHEGRPGHGLWLGPGMVLAVEPPAVEPMVTGSGEDACHPAADGWTPRTNDGSRAARIERTVAVTENGPGS